MVGTLNRLDRAILCEYDYAPRIQSLHQSLVWSEGVRGCAEDKDSILRLRGSGEMI